MIFLIIFNFPNIKVNNLHCSKFYSNIGSNITTNPIYLVRYLHIYLK